MTNGQAPQTGTTILSESQNTRGSSAGLQLFLASLLGLFLQVCLIRWHGTELRAVAYFKNVTLLASFLGLGLGFLLADRRRDWFPLALPLLLAHVLLVDLASRFGVDSWLRHPRTSSGLWFWSVKTAETEAGWSEFAQLAVFYGFFASLLIATLVVFIPIGQLTGRLMKSTAPLRAYSLNLTGSMAGVALFAALSWFWLPPAIWFGLAAFLAVALHGAGAPSLIRSSLCAVVLVACVSTDWGAIVGMRSPNLQRIYSPYQLIELQPFHVVGPEGTRLHRGMAAFANKSYHLKAEDYSKPWLELHGALFPWVVEGAAAYDLPYRFVQRPKRVLVLGSGAGNDVAAALRSGSPELVVDAVEIDPALLEVGRRHHPEQPYLDPRVTAHVGDARHFMRRSKNAYDLIVFGLVDSHTLLSSMSSLRLDNFVYTIESFKDARRLLKPGGRVAVSFSTSHSNHVAKRVYSMLAKAFPEAPPRAFRIGFDSGILFIAGALGEAAEPALPALVTGREITTEMRSLVSDGGPPDSTDDWPFLYMAHREVPSSYVGLCVVLGLIALLSVSLTARGVGLPNGHFFFLGSAFLLIETKAVTELALVWGTTWIVNAVAIFVILLFALLANLWVHRRAPARLWPFYLALMTVILAGFLYPVGRMLEWPWTLAAAVSAALLLLPLFFSGIIFSTSLSRCTSTSSAFASNLLGATVGGFCEYSSMALGYRSLYLIAIALYLLSWLFARSAPPAKS